MRIELRANKKCVSLPVSASYGFEDATGEVKLKIAEARQQANRTEHRHRDAVEEISQKTVGVYLLDATTGAELARSADGRGRHFDVKDEAMPELDRKAASVFAGKVVRKDLVRKVKVGANVPVFVLEYLLGKYCATDDPAGHRRRAEGGQQHAVLELRPAR